MKAYVIIGVVGEYSDRTEWAVKAYMDEARARKEVERMAAESRAIESETLGRYDIDWYDDDNAEVREYRKRVGDQYFHPRLDDWPRYHLTTIDIIDLGWPEKENV